MAQNAAEYDPSWYRADGSRKGAGFLGIMQRPDGRVSSEISIGIPINGKETDVPAMVPTLNRSEVNWLLSNDVSDPSKIPAPIIQKASEFARQRVASGLPVFANANESPARVTPAGAGLLGTSRRPVDTQNLLSAIRSQLQARLMTGGQK